MAREKDSELAETFESQRELVEKETKPVQTILKGYTMALWIHTATVVTRMGNFEDMLRYDCCYPADQNSVLEMAAANDPTDRVERKKEARRKQKESGGKFGKIQTKPYRIRIAKRSDSKTDGFTVDRWASFSCKLEDIKVRKA